MSLDSKAKTTSDILTIRREIEQTPFMYGLADFDFKKWVSLEEAKKEIKEIVAILEHDNSIANGRIQELEKQDASLEAQQAKANEILTEVIFQKDKQGEFICLLPGEVEEISDMIMRLREALKP